MTTKRKAKAKPAEEFIKDPAPEEVSVVPAENDMTYEALLKENVQLHNKIVDLKSLIKDKDSYIEQLISENQAMRNRINDLGNSIINKFLMEYRNG